MSSVMERPWRVELEEHVQMFAGPQVWQKNIADSPKNRSSPPSLSEIGASCSDGESTRASDVESSSKYERVLDSRGGCGKFDHEIQLPHSVPIRDGAGVEDNQT
jgi:hypothetical protein